MLSFIGGSGFGRMSSRRPTKLRGRPARLAHAASPTDALSPAASSPTPPGRRTGSPTAGSPPGSALRGCRRAGAIRTDTHSPAASSPDASGLTHGHSTAGSPPGSALRGRRQADVTELAPSAPTPPAQRRLHRRLRADARALHGWQAARQRFPWAPPSWRHPYRRPQPRGVFTRRLRADARALQRLAGRQAAPSVGAAELAPSAPTPPAQRRLNRRLRADARALQRLAARQVAPSVGAARRTSPSWRHPHRRPQPSGVFTDAPGLTHGHSNGWQPARQRPPWAPPGGRHFRADAPSPAASSPTPSG